MASPASWRSLLFVPSHAARFVSAAPKSGADAYILDLEDSVPTDRKPEARERLPLAIDELSRSADVLVRINGEPETAALDLAAAVRPGLRAIVAPKIDGAETLRSLDDHLKNLEDRQNLAPGSVGVIGQIEDLGALAALDDICRGPRLVGLSLGPEDFSKSAGMTPTSETLYWPNQQVVFACRRHGLIPYGFPGSIAEFSDLAAFGRTAIRGAEMGFVGAFCIHPRQVEPLNAAFGPSPAAIEDARRVVEALAAAEAEGLGAVRLDGRMIDAPVAARAQALLAKAAHPHALNARHEFEEHSLPGDSQ